MDATEKLLYIMILLQFTSCSCLDKITANQTFREGNLLVSKGNEFAFGFFSPGSSSNRYLGIWFYKVSEKSVVWVANRNNPISGSSGVLLINQNGNLVLYSDPDQKVPLWSTNLTVESSESDTPVLQLLDSGNLVLLQGRSERIVWQSFDYPTDTWLSGMRIGLNCKAGFPWMLTSWRSANDPSIGDYSLKLDTRGSPQFFLYKFSKPYWRSTPWPWGRVMDIYNYTYVNNQNEIYYTYNTFDASFILRGVVHYSGFAKWLRQHNGQWKEFWSVPESRCDLYAKCGAFSKCSPSYPDKFECSCLPGYEPKFPRDWLLRDASGGCIMKREDPSSLCGQGEGFVKVENVKLPDTSAAIWVDMNTSHMRCEQECKKNCACSAYTSIGITGKGSGCLAWYGQLWDTVDYAGEGFDLYVRVDAVELAENERKLTASHGKERNILVLSLSSAWIIIFFLTYLWLKRRRTRKKKKSENGVFDPIHGSIYHRNTLLACEVGGSSHPPDITFFDLNTMVTATNNFSPAHKLGQGGFGSVYKGQLFNGQEVAVKRLSRNSVQGIEEFKNEVMLIAKLQHRNLVKLVGCCSEGGEQMLIYEYLPNKSLDSFLFDQRGKSALDWRKRFNLIIGMARGILYLHQDSRLRIIHRDLKSSNILLDAEMNPKISDFGLARIFKADQIQEKTNRVVGTYGYMSPEYAVFGKFSVKSDVFSFGVIMLEIITGKKSNDFITVKSSLCLIGHVSERNYSETIPPTRRYIIYINCSPLVQVWELWIEDNALQVVDSSLKGSYPPHEVLRCIQIGLLCVQEDAAERPTMSEVILMLNSETALPSPKHPAYSFRASSSNTNSFGVGEERSGSVNEVTVTTFVAR